MAQQLRLDTRMPARGPQIDQIIRESREALEALEARQREQRERRMAELNMNAVIERDLARLRELRKAEREAELAFTREARELSEAERARMRERREGLALR